MKRIIAIVVLVLIGCGNVENTTPLPDTIQNMKLHEVTQGEEADQVITQMHRKPVTDQKSYIGEYRGKEYQATLYLTIYSNPESAIQDLEQMTERIRDPQIGGQMGYQHVRGLDSYGENVYMALQNRRAHYFYVIDRHLYWLDANPHVGMAALKELLGKPA